MTGDIVISNGDQIAQALQPVLDKLAITGSQFWEIYVGYIHLDAMLMMGVFLISGLFGIVGAWIGFSGDDSVDERALCAFCFFLLFNIVSFMVLYGIKYTMIRMMCPEYFAIQNIISQVGGLV